MNQEELDIRLQESRAVQDLRRILGLKTLPQTIECFDISHVQGTEKVASMVRFKGGRPDKSHYRKYIIRTVEGIDDFKSIEEVVYRRYARLKREKKKYPDLILVDGGKGQLSSAQKALKRVGSLNVPTVAIAKEFEEIYSPKHPKPLRLFKETPALLLLRHIRDEAHRFALTFHRKRRSKRVYQ